MPRSGLDLLSRLSITLLCAVSVSPRNTGLGKVVLSKAQVAQRGAKGGVTHRQTHHQAQREDAVDQYLTMDGVLSELGVQMQGLWIQGERAEQQVVRFR